MTSRHIDVDHIIIARILSVGCMPLLVGMAGAAILRSQCAGLLLQMATDVFTVLPAWMGGIGGGL